MQGKITKRSVDTLSTPDKGDLVLWDSDLKGLGVRVRSSGVKTYILHYRMAGGRRSVVKKYTIGKHGSPWTPDSARKEAERLLALVNQGTDPAAEKVKERNSPTVEQLCELYLQEGCTTKKPSTLATDKGRINRHIIPLLGKKKAKDVTRADVQRFLQDVANGKTANDHKTGLRGRAIVKGGKGAATRTVGLLGGIFSFAVDRGICAANPVQGVKRYKDKQSQRFLSSQEIAALGETIKDMERAREITSQHAAAIRLLLFTGCRKNEVLSLKWEYVDFERGYITLPDSKTGHKAIPMGPPAAAILSNLPRYGQWVFPAMRGDGHMVGLPKKWELVRERAGIPDVRLHDLRHSFASSGAAAGDSLLVIGKLLGHKDVKTTNQYAHLADDPVKSAADRISQNLAAVMNGGTEEQQSAEVVALPTARKNA